MEAYSSPASHSLFRSESNLFGTPFSRLPSFDEEVTSIRELNVFGGSINIEDLLRIFEDESLRIIPEFGEAALRACADLEYRKLTQEDFLSVMKEYCVLHKNVGSAALAASTAAPLIGAAAIGLVLALVKVSNSIKDRAQKAKDKVKAAEMRARFLRGLATADNLSVEATNIAIVMSEIMARGIDDYETLNLAASSNATIQLLREDLLPYLKSLNGLSPQEVKTAELRQKRWELKQRLIRQYEIVNIHLSRVEQGLAEMKAGNTTYYMKTNRLTAYARECLLEIHLRAWYAMLGYFDPENTMIEYDDRNVGVAASEKVERIKLLFQRYATERLNLLTMKYENKRNVKGISKHEHIVYLADHGADSDNMVPRLSVKQLMIQSHVSCSEPEGGGIDHSPDGSCEIWNDTMFSGADRCSALGKYVDKTIRRYVDDQLRVDGPVWNMSLGFVDKMRRAVQPALPQRPYPLRPAVTMPARFPPLQHQQGYCASISESTISAASVP